MAAHRLLDRALLSALALLMIGCAAPPATAPRAGLAKIQHIVVIYAENRSFDNLYGLFPGADGIANATPEQYTQVDFDGKPLPHLPPVWKGKAPDPAFPKDLPNKPFRIDGPPINMPLSVPTRDLIHKFYPQQEQINGGRNNRFAEVSDAGGLVMGHYDGTKLPMWKWAQEYTLADHFFMSAFGDSYINHFWLICACTPRDPNPPAEPDRATRRPRLAQAASRLSGFRVERSRGVRPRRVHRGRLLAFHESAAVPAVARPARAGRRPAFRRSIETDTAAADAKNDRRHAVGEGNLVGVVCRRVERRGEGRHAARVGQAHDHRQQRAARAVFRHASPAVQLFRALRARHGGPRAAPQGLTPTSSPASTAANCRRSRSTSRREPSTSIRETPT